MGMVYCTSPWGQAVAHSPSPQGWAVSLVRGQLWGQTARIQTQPECFLTYMILDKLFHLFINLHFCIQKM